MKCVICNQEAPETTAFEGQQICPSCDEKVRQYADRVEARHERLAVAAERAEKEAVAIHDRAHQMASIIPFGQPILIGHHSEGRDRRYRARIENTYRRAFERLKQAKSLKRRAEAASESTAIRSDDPAAVIKLREEVARLEARQEHMKAANKAIRDIGKKVTDPAEMIKRLAEAVQIDEKLAAQLLTPDYMGRVGYEDFALKNNNANIRRIKGRVEELSRQQARAVEEGSTEAIYGDIKIRRNVEENRVQIIFPGKPPASTIALLRQRGFVWSGKHGAWQRQLNNGAEYAAKYVVETITRQ